MALAAGARLGPYEIQSLVGAGGMGEVYKAKDTRLDRTVAIKILPPTLAADPQFRERFDREARTISQLDHPHICALHDVGEQNGTAYLVMQYLDGETLADRLTKGALPIDQALQCAIQIAEALDKAHRAGIIHRDLKPGNIFLTKAGAKLVDFGLAKTRASVVSGTGLSMLPTTPANLTAQGTILGTFQYMAPEQLEGQEADARTDIFALGAVVYEMVTAKKAFQGKSQVSLIAAILEHDPQPMSAVQTMTPPALDHAVQKCVAKDPDDRWQTARDVWHELKWIAESPSQVGLPGRVVAGRKRVLSDIRIAWSVSAVLLAAATTLALGAFGSFQRAPGNTPTMRFFVFPPDTWSLEEGGISNVASSPPLAVSPDGQRVAFVARSADGKSLLWIRSLGTLAAESLAGTDGAESPFWAPDNRLLGFFADGKLKKIDVAGGPPVTLCDLPNLTGATWNRDGVILFASPGSEGNSIRRVSAAGGVPSTVTTPDSSIGETGYRHPFFLPDGQHFLYVAAARSAPGIYVASLGSKDRQLLLRESSNAKYSQGYLMFLRNRTLMAQAFDPRHLVLRGDAVPVAEQIQIAGLTGAFTVSETGVLAYQGGVSEVSHQMVWFDRTGRKLRTVGDPGDYSNPALSPDGTKIAVGRRDLQARTRDIWVFDLTRGTSSRFTFDPADDINPVWASDGSRILFTSDRKGYRDIYQKAVTGVGADEVVFESKGPKSLDDVSPDGRYVVYDIGGGGALSGALWVLPLFGDGKPIPFTQGTFIAQNGQLSHDGRWIAYSTDESGSFEVYVQTFPERRGKWQISISGGAEPMWRRDGKELFYLAGEKIIAVDVKASSDQFEAGIPRVLFAAHPVTTVARNRYVVSADGQRFLVNTAVEKGTSSPITVVVNWAPELKK